MRKILIWVFSPIIIFFLGVNVAYGAGNIIPQEKINFKVKLIFEVRDETSLSTAFEISFPSYITKNLGSEKYCEQMLSGLKDGIITSRTEKDFIICRAEKTEPNSARNLVSLKDNTYEFKIHVNSVNITKLERLPKALESLPGAPTVDFQTVVIFPGKVIEANNNGAVSGNKVTWFGIEKIGMGLSAKAQNEKYPNPQDSSSTSQSESAEPSSSDDPTADSSGGAAKNDSKSDTDDSKSDTGFLGLSTKWLIIGGIAVAVCAGGAIIAAVLIRKNKKKNSALGQDPSQGAGYPSAQGGYYPPQSGQDPSQGAGYPPAQGGYYPPQSGQDPSQGAGYPPAQGGYYPPQSGQGAGQGQPPLQQDPYSNSNRQDFPPNYPPSNN